MGSKVTVFGSFVVDLMSRTPHLPCPGETVIGSMFRMGAGGKGFNQGVACHKSGGDVTMITKVGRDMFADVALNTMKELNMDRRGILVTDDAETGTALILVDETTGQNEIVVVSGACGTITDAEIDSFEDIIKNSEYILTQLEVNLDAIEKIILTANKLGTKVILNTAPIQQINDQLLNEIFLVTPNEVEAQIMTGVKIDDEKSALKASRWYFDRGVKNVIITLGSKGVYVNSGQTKGIISPFKVNSVDTTGAGDAFNGGLLTALSEGMDIWQAANFANAVGALSVQKIGTTPSMPTRSEIDDFLIKFKT